MDTLANYIMGLLGYVRSENEELINQEWEKVQKDYGAVVEKFDIPVWAKVALGVPTVAVGWGLFELWRHFKTMDGAQKLAKEKITEYSNSRE